MPRERIHDRDGPENMDHGRRHSNMEQSGRLDIQAIQNDKKRRMIIEFFDTERISSHGRFQAWRTNHQDGVFLTLATRTRAALHGARCQHLGSGPPYFSSKDGLGSLTTKRKICASESELLTWAAKNGLVVTRCQHCVRDRLIGAESGSAVGSPDVLPAQHTSSKSATSTIHDTVAPAVFVRALQLAFQRMADKQLVMLRAHYLAPDHLITADELTSVAGLASHRDVNSQYGRFGSLLRECALKLDRRGGQQSYAFVTFLPPDARHGSWRWQLRPSFAEALATLGWFDDGIDSFDRADIRDVAAREGQLRRREIWHRHREQGLRFAKIDRVRGAHPDDRLTCQVPNCGFDFEMVYGELGRGYAEVHHIVALRELDPGTITTLDDLIVVCSNCHRMIHRGGECRPWATLIEPKRRL